MIPSQQPNPQNQIANSDDMPATLSEIARLETLFNAAAQGLEFGSETEAPLTFVHIPTQTRASLSFVEFQQACGIIHCEERDFSNDGGKTEDCALGADSFPNADAEKAEKLAKLVEENLTDCVSYAICLDPQHADNEHGNFALYFVGRTKSGELVGYKTHTAWT